MAKDHVHKRIDWQGYIHRFIYSLEIDLSSACLKSTIKFILVTKLFTKHIYLQIIKNLAANSKVIIPHVLQNYFLGMPIFICRQFL